MAAETGCRHVDARSRRLRAPAGRRSVSAARAGSEGGRLLPIVLLLAILGGCASQPAVEVYLIGMTPVESNLFEQRMRLDFRVQNAGDRPISATGLQVTLNVNDARLARGVDSTPFTVPRLGDVRTSAVVSTSLFDIANQLLRLPGQDRFSYELTGKIYVDGWPLGRRFQRTGEITRAQLQRLSGAAGAKPAPLLLEAP